MSDLINRQDAIDVAKAEIDGGTPNDITWKLESLPSVQKKGEWIKDWLCSTTGGTYGVNRCSICESYYQDVGYGWNFCPNCGADMRGDKNE